MTRIALALALAALVVAPACGGKKEEGGGAAKSAEGTKAGGGAATTETPAAADKPLVMDAPALFADFTKPDQDGMALLTKYKPGVLVTGTVTQVITEEAGNSSVWLDGGDGNKISLGFKDDGKAAKDKGVKKDDKISAQCNVGGADGKLMMLIDCDLK